jgi:hypothetical protein
MARKTVDVEWVKSRVNYFLANSHDNQGRERMAHANLLASILDKTDQYKGFRYLDLVRPNGPDTPVDWDATDETRREYY